MSKRLWTQRAREWTVVRATSRSRGLERVELVSTGIALAVSTTLYLAYGEPYLARGVVGDLVGLALLTTVITRWRRRLRHEALVCLVGIALVLAVHPEWPLRVREPFWWATIALALAGYVALRQRLVH